MKNQPFVPLKTTAYFPPSNMKTNIPSNHHMFISFPKQVVSQEFFTISDGIRRDFAEEDGLVEYGPQKILSPMKISYMNLFINGVLQPKMNYEVADGHLKLLTEDIPVKGTPIILQMITYS